jgi:hypothetical protein
MTNSTVDQLVDSYLTRLADAAQALPPGRSAELVSEIREHIAASMSGGTGADEAAVRTMLDRLGDPADIVAAAVEDDPPEHPSNPGPHPGRRPSIGLEVGAVVMLTVGSFIPIIGWLVGVILLWSSGLWRRSEKLMGTLIFPGGPGLVLTLGSAVAFMAIPAGSCVTPASTDPSGPQGTAVEVCTGSVLPQILGIAILIFVVIAPIVVAIVLLKRARARAALEDD